MPYCVNRQYLKCEKCYRKNHKCELTSNYKRINEAIRKRNVLDDKILKIQLKLSRKKNERKHWLRRLRDLDDKEFENILKLKENKIKDEMLKHSFIDFFTIIFFDFSFMSFSAFSEFLRSFSSITETASASSDSWLDFFVIFMYCLSEGILFTWWDTSDLFFLESFLPCIIPRHSIRN